MKNQTKKRGSAGCLALALGVFCVQAPTRSLANGDSTDLLTNQDTMASIAKAVTAIRAARSEAAGQRANLVSGSLASQVVFDLPGTVDLVGPRTVTLQDAPGHITEMVVDHGEMEVHTPFPATFRPAAARSGAMFTADVSLSGLVDVQSPKASEENEHGVFLKTRAPRVSWDNRIAGEATVYWQADAQAPRRKVCRAPLIFAHAQGSGDVHDGVLGLWGIPRRNTATLRFVVSMPRPEEFGEKVCDVVEDDFAAKTWIPFIRR